MNIRVNISLCCKTSTVSGDCICCSFSLIVFRTLYWLYHTVVKNLDGWEALNCKSLSELFLNSGINFTQFNLTFKVFGSLCPFRLKCFAMATPWCIKFNHPNIFRLEYHLVKVLISEDNDTIFFFCFTASWTFLIASFWLLLLLLLLLSLSFVPRFIFLIFLARDSVFNSFRNFVHCKTYHVFSTSLTLISHWWLLFIKAHELNSWKSCDTILLSKCLFFISINGADFDDTLKIFSYLLPSRCKLFTMATPWSIKL